MKYLRKKEKSPVPFILIGVGVVIALVLLAWFVLKEPPVPQEEPGVSVPDENATGGSEVTQPSEQTDATVDTTEATIPALALPYFLEDGKLRIDSIFQFSGMNPDRQDEWAEDVAAIQLTNTSDEHLSSLTLTVVTTEGTAVSFQVSDIPPGVSALVMSPDNALLENNPDCAQILCEAVFLPQVPLATDQLLITVMGTEITVENISGDDLTDITLYCHSMLDQSCYGGTVSLYEIDSLPAGESTVVSAWDCVLGMVEVVRIEIGSE